MRKILKARLKRNSVARVMWVSQKKVQRHVPSNRRIKREENKLNKTAGSTDE